jgi:hypothetical protein
MPKSAGQPNEKKDQTNGRQQEIDPRENVGNRSRWPQEAKEHSANAKQRYEQTVPKGGINMSLGSRRDECVRHRK